VRAYRAIQPATRGVNAGVDSAKSIFFGVDRGGGGSTDGYWLSDNTTKKAFVVDGVWGIAVIARNRNVIAVIGKARAPLIKNQHLAASN